MMRRAATATPMNARKMTTAQSNLDGRGLAHISVIRKEDETLSTRPWSEAVHFMDFEHDWRTL